MGPRGCCVVQLLYVGGSECQDKEFHLYTVGGDASLRIFDEGSEFSHL